MLLKHLFELWNHMLLEKEAGLGKQSQQNAQAEAERIGKETKEEEQRDKEEDTQSNNTHIHDTLIQGP